MTRSRNELLAEADSILRQPHLSRESSARVTSILELADALTEKSELRKATMLERDRDLGRVSEVSAPTPEDLEFRSYLAASDQAEARELAQQRAQSTTTTAGGYLVPATFANRLEVALKATDGILDACSTFETDTGTAFGFPELEDTSSSNVGTIVAENAVSISGPDAVFATVAYSACPQWQSGLILASTEVISDSKFDFADLLAAAGGVRLARGIGVSLVTTLLAGSTSGVTAASATAVTPDELISLVDSVDSAYGDRGAWAMKSSTYRTILKLKASTGGSFMFEAERSPDGRPLLLGSPVYFCPSMPAMTTGLKPIIFGDLSRLQRRIVANSLVVRVLVERYAEYSQSAFNVLLRTDAQLLKTASSQPTKYLVMA